MEVLTLVFISAIMVCHSVVLTFARGTRSQRPHRIFTPLTNLSNCTFIEMNKHNEKGK